MNVYLCLINLSVELQTFYDTAVSTSNQVVFFSDMPLARCCILLNPLFPPFGGNRFIRRPEFVSPVGLAHNFYLSQCLIDTSEIDRISQDFFADSIKSLRGDIVGHRVENLGRLNARFDVNFS